MTTTTVSRPVTIPAPIRNRATRLVSDLAAVAGDNTAVFDALEKHMLATKEPARMAVMFAALGITFGECIAPADDNNPVPVDWTAANTQGEHP